MQERDSLPEHERVWQAQLEAARQADGILLQWFFEAHPEHLAQLRYRRRDDGLDPVPCFTSPQALVDYARWCLAMNFDNRSGSVELLTLGQAGLLVQRAQAEGRLPADADGWEEARKMLKPSPYGRW